MTYTKLIPCLLIIVVVFNSCGSDADKKKKDNSFFPDYGIQEGEVIIIDISSPEINVSDGSSGSASAGGGASGSVDSSYQKTMTLEPGATAQLSVDARDISGKRYSDVPVTWTSSDSSIVSVDSSGKITAVSAGTATITATLRMSDGTVIKDIVIVTVLPFPVQNKSWSLSKVRIPAPIWDHASTVWNGYLYVSGGNSSCDGKYQACGFTDQVYFTRLKPDGSLEGFRASASLPRTLRGHAMLAYNNYIYIIGGIVQPYFDRAPYPDPENYETLLNEKVYFATIKTDGSLGDWKETSPLPAPREDLPPEKAGLFALSAVVHKGYIYVTGGWSVALKSNVSRVLTGPINEEDGSVKPWIHNEKSDMLFDLSKHTSVAMSVNGNNYLYVIGGNSGAIGSPQVFRREIYHARIESDGIPYNWAPASKTLPFPLIDHASAAFDRHIFIIGGRSGDDVMYYNKYSTVYSYMVNDNGTLGPVKTWDPLPVPLFHHAAVADKNSATGTYNIYVTGGSGGDTELQENRKDSVYFLAETP